MEALKLPPKPEARSPTLQTVLMVEKFIDENSGEYGKTAIFNNLPKKVMWGTFQIIMQYLKEINKIIIEGDGKVVYIWNPEFFKKNDILRTLKGAVS